MITDVVLFDQCRPSFTMHHTAAEGRTGPSPAKPGTLTVVTACPAESAEVRKVNGGSNAPATNHANAAAGGGIAVRAVPAQRPPTVRSRGANGAAHRHHRCLTADWVTGLRSTPAQRMGSLRRRHSHSVWLSKTSVTGW